MNSTNIISDLFTLKRFSLTDTGGGVEQWLSQAQSGGFVIVTDLDGEQPEKADQAVIVGWYDCSGDIERTEQFESLEGFVESWKSFDILE